MKTSQILVTSKQLCKKMKQDGHNPTAIETTKWVLNHFNDYCKKKSIVSVNIDIAAHFFLECYGFNLYKPFLPVHSTLRRPVLLLLDFYDTGKYALSYSYVLRTVLRTDIAEGFEILYTEYQKHVQTLDCSKSTKSSKMSDFKRYVKYLSENGISDIRNTERSMVYAYINSLQDKYSPKTMKTLKYSLRVLHDWLYSAGYLPYDSKAVFPWIHDARRSRLPSYYSKNEVKTLLDSIDVSTARGKFYYCVLCLAAYLGMRAGDIINLRFSEIDWGNSRICYVQRKTGQMQCLPLLDEVKYPLIDYIKNARKNCETDKVYD